MINKWKLAKWKDRNFYLIFILIFWHKNRWCDDIINTNYVIIQTEKNAVKYDKAETEGSRILLEGKKNLFKGYSL